MEAVRWPWHDYIGQWWLNGDTGIPIRAVWPPRPRRCLPVTVAVRGELAVALTNQIMSSEMGFMFSVRTGFTKMVSGKPQDHSVRGQVPHKVPTRDGIPSTKSSCPPSQLVIA